MVESKEELKNKELYDMAYREGQLTKIQINGFKSIRECSIDLKPINVLIGSNGAGKSNFISAFTLSSFTLIKRLFSSSLLSVIRVVSSEYLNLLIFLLAILIPACASFSPVLCMMYSVCKLNEQGDNIQP